MKYVVCPRCLILLYLPHVLLCFFPTMTSVRIGAFKVRTSQEVSRNSIRGLLKERFNGGQLKVFKKLTRNVRATDDGTALYVETADDLDTPGREELAALTVMAGWRR